MAKASITRFTGFSTAVLAIVIAMTFSNFICIRAEGATGDCYKYTREDTQLSQIVYEDFEDFNESSDFIAADYPKDGADYTYGLFSFLCPGTKAKLIKEDPLSDYASIVFKDFLDARTWMIHTTTEFDSAAYVMEFKLRIDDMPNTGDRFSFKITDVNSKEKDNEDPGNPIIYFANAEGKIGLYNQDNTLLKEVEKGSVYSVAVACDVGTSDYYVFIDGTYVPGSKATFNVEFAQLSAFRFDIAGEGVTVTLDDIVADGCKVEKIESPAEPTASAGPTASAEPTDATESLLPTQGPATETTGTTVPTGAPSTEANSSSGNTSDNTNTESEYSYLPTIIAISAGVILLVALVIVIVAVIKKK